MLDEMIQQWGGHINRNRLLSKHYNGKVGIKDLGVGIPPQIVKMFQGRTALMWSKQVVNRIADCSVIEGFQFKNGTPAGFLDMMDRNEIVDQYDETLPSQLTHGLSLWTVTAGLPGEPPVIISSYDAEHATALYDYRHRTTLAGLSIVDVDIHQPHEPTALNFYAPDGSIIEAEKTSTGRWIYNRLANRIGRCAMEIMRNDPDRNYPFGKPAITPAIIAHEDEANRQFVRMATAEELGAAPQKWLMGVDEDYFDSKEWEAYCGSILMARTDDDENPPTTGQYAATDATPHIAYIRQLANQVAAEGSIPIHSLLYTEANPASAEAIEASRHDLIEKVEKLNRHNGHTLRNIGLMALSIMEQTPVDQLGENERSLTVKFRNPLHPTLASSADAAAKTAQVVPGFAGTPTYWRMLGFDDAEIEALQAEIAANDQQIREQSDSPALSGPEDE
jgi:hypothetical protein